MEPLTKYGERVAPSPNLPWEEANQNAPLAPLPFRGGEWGRGWWRTLPLTPSVVRKIISDAYHLGMNRIGQFQYHWRMSVCPLSTHGHAPAHSCLFSEDEHE